MVVAVEVGYSETYGKLLDAKDMWINGRGVNVVMLGCYQEKPRVEHRATPPYRDITDWQREWK
ncbi:hypothetical protein V1515DRAFT_532842 [Lipomyces mesembrius]